MSAKLRFGFFLAVVFTAIAAAPMLDVLRQTDAVLAFNDGSVETGLSPMFRFPQALLRIWDNQFFFGSGSRQYWLSVHALNESLLGPHAARREGVVAILVLCALAGYWSLRQFRIRPAAAAFAAGVCMLSGLSFSFAVAGLYVRPIAVACAALALGFAERGRSRDGLRDYLLAGGFVGLGISEVPDVGAFLAITVAGVVAVRHVQAFGWTRRHLVRLLLREAALALCALLLAWQTVTTISATTIQGVTQGESREQRFAWATQWSIPPAETWDLVAGTYFGTSMANPDMPYWGRIGRSEGWERTHQGYRNFRMSAWYAGAIPSILLLALVPRLWRRRPAARPVGAPVPADERGLVAVVIVGSLLTLMLSWGKYFPLYRLVWSLPFFGTVRNPDKWNAPFMLLMMLGVGLALDALLAATTSAPVPGKATTRAATAIAVRPYWLAVGVIAGLALLFFLGKALDRPGFVARLAAEGYGAVAPSLWLNSLLACLKVSALAAGFAAAAWWGVRTQRGGVILLAAAALTFADLSDSGRHFAQPHTYQRALAPNALTDFLDQHAREGRLLLLPPSDTGDPRDPRRAQMAALSQILNQMRMTVLMARGYDLFNPVSVSRMPTDYESLFGAVGSLTPRLLELGSIRWIITVPGLCDALNRMDGDRGRFVERLALGLAMAGNTAIPVAEGPPEQRVLRVVEFTGALPKFQPVTAAIPMAADVEGEKAALARLAAPAFDPRREALVYTTVNGLGGLSNVSVKVDVLRETPAETEIRVVADAPVLLVRSVKFDPDWVISGGGAEAHPIRVNYLFQGIPVAAGDHTLRLRYEPSLAGFKVAALGRAGLLLLMVLGARRVRRAVAHP